MCGVLIFKSRLVLQHILAFLFKSSTAARGLGVQMRVVDVPLQCSHAQKTFRLVYLKAREMS